MTNKELISKIKVEIGRLYDGKAPKHDQQCDFDDGYLLGIDVISRFIDSLQQEQSKKRLIQVKCLYPYNESWQKNKVYTCKVWHHGDLNRDFWDVYYDYGKDPKYVQFPTIELLNEEFAIIQEESQVKQEQLEVDLEKLGGIARHLIAVKNHEEDMRLDEGEWLLLERIGYPERFNARKEE